MSVLAADRAAEILRGASAVRVLVVGDLMLDRYVSGRVDRVSPEAPVPVVRVEREWVALGGAGNVAANVTALGAACCVVGCAGDDADGAELLAELAARDADASGVVRTPDRPTTVKTRVGAGPQQIVRFDREVDEEVDEAVASAIVAEVRRLMAGCHAVVVQDYDKGVLTSSVVEAVLALAKSSGTPVVADPKRRRFFDYRGATVLKPNRRELQEALGEPVRASDAGWMEAARARLDCDHLLVTLGEQGMSLVSGDGRWVQLSIEPEEVYDVSGAGDTVSAVVALALAAEASVAEAAALATHAAAVEVRRPGVRTVTATEVMAHIRAGPNHPIHEEVE